MPKINVQGLQMYYEVEGDGIPLVLISGLSGDHFAWAFQVPAFTAAGYRCLVFDNRDAGQTDESPLASYSIRQCAEDTVALMDHLGLDAAHMLGASMGGMIAQEIALNHPARVSSLTLVCTSADVDAAVGGIVRSWRTLRPFVSSEEFLRVMSPWLFTYRFYGQPEPLDAVMQMARDNPFPQTPARFARQCEAILTHDTDSRIAAVTVPTHVIVGSEDVLTPPRFSYALAAKIPRARLTEIPSSGHGLFWEQTPQFNQAVLEFLDEQPTRGVAVV